jgi:DNA-binding XRE family transcriptional regulator
MNTASRTKLDAPALAAEIRKRIEAKGMTQSEVAKTLSINRSQISQILSGKCKKHGSAIRKVCDVLEINPDEYRPIGPNLPPLAVEMRKRIESKGLTQMDLAKALSLSSKATFHKSLAENARGPEEPFANSALSLVSTLPTIRPPQKPRNSTQIKKVSHYEYNHPKA